MPWKKRLRRSTLMLLAVLCAFTALSLVHLTSKSARIGSSSYDATDPVYDACTGRYNVTIVTAYFSINSSKDAGHVDWLRSFATFVSPVLFFTDDLRLRSQFDAWRAARQCSKSYLVRRSQLWPWQNVPEVHVARNSTVSSPDADSLAYLAAVNSKYPLIERAVKVNPFRTSHFAWLDPDVFRWRSVAELDADHVAEPLADLAPNSVGYLHVAEPGNWTAANIFLQRRGWLATCAFFGRLETMALLAEDFSRFAQLFLSLNLVAADQHVIAAMFVATDRHQFGEPRVRIQAYRPYPPEIFTRWWSNLHSEL